MSFVDVIAKTRDGVARSHEDVDAVVSGVSAVDVPGCEQSVVKGRRGTETSEAPCGQCAMTENTACI